MASTTESVPAATRSLNRRSVAPHASERTERVLSNRGNVLRHDSTTKDVHGTRSLTTIRFRPQKRAIGRSDSDVACRTTRQRTADLYGPDQTRPADSVTRYRFNAGRRDHREVGRLARFPFLKQPAGRSSDDRIAFRIRGGSERGVTINGELRISRRCSGQAVQPDDAHQFGRDRCRWGSADDKYAGGDGCSSLESRFRHRQRP